MAGAKLQIASLGILLWAASLTGAQATQIELPLNLDYLLLDAAVQQRFYSGPGGRWQLWNDPGNCGHFYAVDPHFSRSGANVQFKSQSDLQAAIALGGQCMDAMSWHGNLVAITTPQITGFTLRFPITDLNFYGADGTSIGGAAFGLVKSGVIDQIANFSYDLHPQFEQLQALANGLPPTSAAAQLKVILASLHPAPQVVPHDDGVEVGLQIDVPESFLSQSVAPLTPMQKASWRDAAANVSTFLTTVVARTQALMPDAQLRDEVASVATDSRSRIDAMAKAPPAGGDPLPLLRDDWQRLGTALKSAAQRGAFHDQTVAVLTIVTVMDFVFALDQRAPGLGIQISQTGLQKLAEGLPNG